MPRLIKKITALVFIFALISCTIRQAKPMTLCDELTEGLTIEEIYATLTDEQLVECGYESPCYESEVPEGEDGDPDYSDLYISEPLIKKGEE